LLKVISSDYTAALCARDSDAKILLLIIDGLGGLPHPSTGKSELETAHLPNLDELAASGSCGLISPLGPGHTPGSGPAHLALFGYDPWRTVVGRGALSALGLGVDFAPGDVAARVNFCTVDDGGRVTDRRAGRISTEKCAELCRRLESIDIPHVSVSVVPEMDYRAAAVFRGSGLGDEVGDSDPQTTGLAPLALQSRGADSERTKEAAESFLRQAAERLRGESPANMVIVRGFGSYPQIPQMEDVYGLKAAVVADYPMYRGVARAVGMEIVPTGSDLSSKLQALTDRWPHYDFFYVHVKKTDSAGEDGDFNGKVRLLEEVDAFVASLRDLGPDVLIVTGDHSTPSIMASHSWHSVPMVISSNWSLSTGVATEFSERGCLGGSIGQIPSSSLMALALAHARRLSKFGA
jgi:2,3-bisphosphoglycerate-independent phosphoglycerate mutase